VAGDDDDQRLGAMLSDVMQSVEAARAGQAQVEEDGVGARAVEQAVGLFGGLGGLGVEAERLGTRGKPRGWSGRRRR